MNIKSYMRGIGAGMIVAALIMGVSKPAVVAEKLDKQTLIETVSQDASDEKIEKIDDLEVQRKEIEANNENVTSVVRIPDVIEDKEDSDEVSEKELENEAEPETGDSVPEIEEITPPAIDPMPADEDGYTINDETVEIRVIAGDSSVSVSRRLFEAGVVESAVELDQYLCQNGYDKYICVGVYDIPLGSDFERIGKILTRSLNN